MSKDDWLLIDRATLAVFLFGLFILCVGAIFGEVLTMKIGGVLALASLFSGIFIFSLGVLKK